MIELLFFSLLLIAVVILGLFSGFFALIILALQKLLSLFRRRRKRIEKIQTTLNSYLETNHDKEEPYADNEWSEFKGFESSAVMDMEDED